MVGQWDPGAPPRALAVGATVAAAGGAVAAAATAGTTEAVALAALEALIASAVAVAWRSRGVASWLVGAGALAWASAIVVTILIPDRATDLAGTTIRLPVAAVLVLAFGTLAFARNSRRDIITLVLDMLTALVAAMWLLAELRSQSAPGWTAEETVLVLGGALAAAIALAVVAHATDLAARLTGAGTLVAAGAAAALAAAQPDALPDWWTLPSALGFLLVTAGALTAASAPDGVRGRAPLWAIQLPITPAAVAVGVALVQGGVNGRARWALVVVVVAALARQTVVSAHGQIRMHRLEQTLGSFRHDAEHDPLTGLANRALFHQRIERALEHPRRRSFAVLFIDLDDFKTINDTLGHAAGDELLVGVAHRLRASVRAEDTVARLGGDEFGILLNGLEGFEDAKRSAARLLDALQPPFAVGGTEIRAGTSLGLAPFGPRSTTSQLLREADMALYAAKDRGKNQFQVFSWTMQRDARDRFELQAELRQAIEREELVIHYQPIVDLPSGRVAGFEALTRWQHSTRGVLLPDRFIPLAEELGVIHALGLVVLRTACNQLAEWEATFTDAPQWHIAVNVSVQQFDSPDLLADVTEVLRESKIAPGRIVLEVTESTMADDPEHVLHVLQQLRAFGVRVAIDDFGTGYSALQYLRRFPLDMLKIDKAFVADIETGANGVTLLKAMLELGHSLGVGTVVEGVESHAQLETVRALGCDFVQGYLLATPGSAAEITGILRTAAGRDWTLLRGAPADHAPTSTRNR